MLRPGFWAILISKIPGVAQAFDTAAEESRRAGTLQAEVISLRQQLQAAHAQASEAIANERNTYKMMLNVEYMSKYGMRPYPDAMGLPDSYSQTGQPQTKFVHASDLARNGSREAKAAFLREAEDPST